MAAPLLDIRDLEVGLLTSEGRAIAVSGLSYTLDEGETLAIVGESGSGKSLQALAILGLLPRDRSWVNGKIMFDGLDLAGLSERQLRDIRGAKIGMIFQDPMTSLNPVLSIGRQIAEPLVRHLGLSYEKARARVIDLLRLVRIPDAERRIGHYPFQFSGGMRQRVMIAMAIACKPRLLIGDEPTTALDVTVQGQIIDLVNELRQELNLTVMWITHDMGVVAAMADTVQVLYGGRIMERGPVSQVFADPRSAYTWSLLRSVPSRSHPPRTPLFQIKGQPLSLMNRPKGDPFAPRNPFATARCHKDMPPLRPVSLDSPKHLVAAWYDLPAELAKIAERP